MSQKEKLIEKLKNNPNNVRFEVIQNLLLSLGFEEKQPNTGSSHYTYTKGGSECMEASKDINYHLALHYKFEIQQDEDGTYFIEYPDLKGCMSCGDTVDEAIKMGEDAKKCWIEACFEKNIYIPEPTNEEAYSGNFRIRMPKTLHKKLSEKASKEGISMNQYCIYLLSKEFTEEELKH